MNLLTFETLCGRLSSIDGGAIIEVAHGRIVQMTRTIYDNEIEDTAYHLAALGHVPETHRGPQMERLALKLASWIAEDREQLAIKVSALLAGDSRDVRMVVLEVLRDALPGKLPMMVSPTTETLILADQTDLLMTRLISIAKHDAKWKRDILAAGLRDELGRDNRISQAAAIIAQGASYLDDLDCDTRLRVGQVCRVLFDQNN